MVVLFTTTTDAKVCKVDSSPFCDHMYKFMQMAVIYVLLRVHGFPLPIKLTAMISI